VTARKSEPVDPETLPPPLVIARQIARDLRAAQREFDAVIRSLEGREPEPPSDEQLALPV
jgi:hypothetical protein